ncbi:MAG: hypothetical protein IKH07_05575, partial [Oscillospiraceae bacterium]|nr:hypothetical protein [Oscillospiraceae bacterium]
RVFGHLYRHREGGEIHTAGIQNLQNVRFHRRHSLFDFNKSERIFIATQIYHNVPPNAILPVHPVPEGANLVPYSDDSTPRLKKRLAEGSNPFERRIAPE